MPVKVPPGLHEFGLDRGDFLGDDRVQALAAQSLSEKARTQEEKKGLHFAFRSK
jgi:hypothetical protein